MQRTYLARYSPERGSRAKEMVGAVRQQPNLANSVHKMTRVEERWRLLAREKRKLVLFILSSLDVNKLTASLGLVGEKSSTQVIGHS